MFFHSELFLFIHLQKKWPKVIVCNKRSWVSERHTETMITTIYIYIHTHLHTKGSFIQILRRKQISSEDLLYNTRDNIEYLIITYNESNLKNTYIKLNHFAGHLKLTQYCNNNTSI